MPRPSRKTPRISENAYTVAPKSSDSSRVHRTWHASAVMPEIAMATYTVVASGARTIAPARLARRLVRRDLRHRQANDRDEHVQRDGDVGRDRHVVDAQQVEAREQAADDRAADVAAVEEAEPRHARSASSRPSGRWPAASRP